MKPKKNSEFIIPFSGLKVGEHAFDFTISDTFFQNIEYSELQSGNIKVKLKLNKQATVLVLDFDIKGIVNVMCDRCTDYFDLPVETTNQLIVKIDGEDFKEGDEIISIPASEGEIDIAHYIYENIILAMPYQRIHPEDESGKSTCNPEMLEKLKQLLLEDEEKKPEIDPRWNALKGLNLN